MILILENLSSQTEGECIVFLFNNEKPIEPHSRRHFTAELNFKFQNQSFDSNTFLKGDISTPNLPGYLNKKTYN